jgi:predicted ribosome quality control (RQC) complex YloA/Tae2 family protein
VQQDGELVKASLSRIPRGAKSIEVEDFFSAEAAMRTIALDPKLSPHENLERIFERAKKLERARSVVGEELDMARAKLATLETFLSRANADGADFDALAKAAVDARVLEPQQTAPAGKKPVVAPRVPYKTFQGFAGGEIRVGRTAKDNDELTFRHASGNDVWMHTADTPGSHVVLRVMKGREPHPEELLDAAHLAVHFSPMKDATRARVHTARRKDVHKPRGAKPGLVTLSGGKILELRMQPARLQRLLGTHRPPPGTD